MSGDADESERQLAAAAVGGDRRAFEELVGKHKSALYRFARRYVGDADEAYDIVQDSFVSAWISLRRFDAQQSFGAWLRAIALNKCRDYGRRKSVRRRILLLFARDAQQHPSVTNVADPCEESAESLRLRLLGQAIADLPQRYKDPLLLTMYGTLSHQETAVRLKTSTKAVEMRIRRAKKKLAAALNSLKSNISEG